MASFVVDNSPDKELACVRDYLYVGSQVCGKPSPTLFRVVARQSQHAPMPALTHPNPFLYHVVARITVNGGSGRCCRASILR